MVSTSGNNRCRRFLVNWPGKVVSEMERVKLSKTVITNQGTYLTNHTSICITTAFHVPRPSFADRWHRASSQPHGGLKYGGASPVDPSKPTVAGTSAESRRGNSADHNVKTRDDAKTQDGTAGGGVGVAEMRERKMAGQGLPSPQVSLALHLDFVIL